MAEFKPTSLVDLLRTCVADDNFIYSLLFGLLMAKKSTTQEPTISNGDVLHQIASGDTVLTTNQGLPIADNQNMLNVGPRGSQLLEDFILREKITHLDDATKLIPEELVPLTPLGKMVLDRGFQSNPSEQAGQKLRIRPESFADYYTQSRLFYKSMTEPEQRHLQNIDESLAKLVAEKLGMSGQADNIKPRVPVGDPTPSPALSQYSKATKSIAGKKVGVLVSDEILLELAAVIDWIRDGFGHLKVIGFVDGAKPLFEKASVPIVDQPDVFNVTQSKLDDLIEQAKLHRIWNRERKVR